MTAGSLGGGGVAGGGGSGDETWMVAMPFLTLQRCRCRMAHICPVPAICRLNWLWVLPLPLGGRGRRGWACNPLPRLPAIAATSFLAAARVRRVAASAAAVGSIAITASQYVAATAAAAFRAAVAAVAISAATAAVGAAAAAAFAPGSAGAGLQVALANSLRSLAQVVLLSFLRSRLCALDQCLTSRCLAVCWLPWAHTLG
jgi:hypothetical protein